MTTRMGVTQVGEAVQGVCEDQNNLRMPSPLSFLFQVRRNLRLGSHVNRILVEQVPIVSNPLS